jgi:hypothetical protein
MCWYLALLDKFSCLIAYKNFIVYLRGFLKLASVVFHNSAQKEVKDAFKHARFQSIAYYHRNVLKQPMNSRQAKASNLYLQKDEYLQGDVD